MDLFLASLKQESAGYKETAISIDEVQRKLTVKFSELEADANHRIFGKNPIEQESSLYKIGVKNGNNLYQAPAKRFSETPRGISQNSKLFSKNSSLNSQNPSLNSQNSSRNSKKVSFKAARPNSRADENIRRVPNSARADSRRMHKNGSQFPEYSQNSNFVRHNRDNSSVWITGNTKTASSSRNGHHPSRAMSARAPKKTAAGFDDEYNQNFEQFERDGVLLIPAFSDFSSHHFARDELPERAPKTARVWKTPVCVQRIVRKLSDDEKFWDD